MKKVFYLGLLLYPRGKRVELPSLPVIPQKPKISWLKTQGRNIVNEEGGVMVLRGVNLAGLKWERKDWHPKAVEKERSHFFGKIFPSTLPIFLDH